MHRHGASAAVAPGASPRCIGRSRSSYRPPPSSSRREPCGISRHANSSEISRPRLQPVCQKLRSTPTSHRERQEAHLAVGARVRRDDDTRPRRRGRRRRAARRRRRRPRPPPLDARTARRRRRGPGNRRLVPASQRNGPPAATRRAGGTCSMLDRRAAPDAAFAALRSLRTAQATA